MRTATGLLSLAGVALLAASSHAGVIARIEIIAENAQGIASWSRTLSPSADGGFEWGTTSPTSSASPLADGVLSNGVQIFGAGLGWIHDPVVTSSFNMSAGISNTTITVNSAILSFDPIVDGTAIANASITVTDSATFGTAGQVWIQGLQGNNRAFAARVRSSAVSSPVDLFSLVTGSTQAVPTGSTFTYTGSNAAFPAYDFVPGMVTEISSQFRFTLSAGDRAAGTSYFEIIPAPGSAGVLALGGLMAARRRRR